MKVIVVLAHPNRGSFNHAIANTIHDALKAKNHEVFFHDLYSEQFNPILPHYEMSKGHDLDPTIKKYCKELIDCGGLIFVHPNWWGQPPAILKGWIDRVIRPGVAYQFAEGDSGEGIPRGLLQGKIGIVINTSDTPGDREKNIFGDPLDALWKKCIFEFCGITNYYRRMFHVIVTSTLEKRREWLDEVRQIISNYFP